MDREIKFRAWDRVNNKMIFTNEGDDYDFWDIVSFSSVEMVNKIFENKRYDFMQFTGLHDKNGVPIYEGDILDYGYVVNYVDGSDNANSGLNCGWYEQRNFFESYSQLEVGFEYNVIGNIYENRELLK